MTVGHLCLRLFGCAIVLMGAATIDVGRAQAGSSLETATAGADTPTPTQTVPPTRPIPPIEISCEITVDPPVPRVGDMVWVCIMRHTTGGGYPAYELGTTALLSGERVEGSSSCFERHALQPGSTTLSGSTTDEFVTGYNNGQPSYSFYSAHCSKAVTVLEAPTPTPTSGSPTPTFTPTSCVSDAPLVELSVGPPWALRRTLTGFNRGLFCFRGGSISVSGDAEPLSVNVNCDNGTYTADIRLSRPDEKNTVTVCHHPAVCGAVGCRSIDIQHVSQRTLSVDTTEDGPDQNPGDELCATAAGKCTLRAAIEESTTPRRPDAAYIELPGGTYTLALAGADDDSAATGDLDVLGDVIIFGTGANVVIIEGDSTSAQRVFDVHENGALYLSGVSVRGGRSQGGAGIKNTGFVSLERVTLSGNLAGAPDGTGGYGGGFWNRGRARLSEVSVEGNTADAIDGIGTSSGGGIWNNGLMRITRSTISGNSAVSGGGMFNGGSIEVTNSTISGNSACCQGAGSLGGGVFNQGGLTLRNVTIAANGAVGGGNGLDGPAAVAFSILADNPPNASPGFTRNCGFGTVVLSGGFNIDSDGTCGFRQSTDRVVDPLLLPLSFNGGSTRTHGLQAGSPAIDAAGTADCESMDQRGVARPVDGDGYGGAECDIGAVEFNGEVDRACLGDCNGDGVVRVDEVVRAVAIALGHNSLEMCRAVDGNASGDVAVNELVGAVSRLLRGCAMTL